MIYIPSLLGRCCSLNRGGKGPNFSSQAQALSVEPKRARACQNSPRARFEPEHFTNKIAKIRPNLEPFGKLGLLSCEPGAYLLRVKISALGLRARAQARSTSTLLMRTAYKFYERILENYQKNLNTLMCISEQPKT